MALWIKNWDQFQHYKSGRGAPPWIKLYRKLLDDKQWFLLPPSSAKFLVSVWILSAETNGMVPDIDVLAFRLRMTSKDVAECLKHCSHWIINDASNVLAECKQLATPETETETETETEEPLASSDESLSAGKKKINGSDLSPVIEKIPIIGDREHEVHQSSVQEWERLFPAVDVPQTLKEIRAWNLANPKNRKTATGVVRHITQWLAKEQNKPPPMFQNQRR